MKWLTRGAATPAISTLAPRERVLAWARAADGSVLAGTRDALHLAPGAESATPGRRLAWEQVEAADWDVDSSTFRLSEVGQWGQVRAQHVFVLDEARSLLELVRERVTASIVVQRRFAVSGGGLLVIARRAPHGGDALTWFFEYDESVDPEDPQVRAAAQQALATAKADVGLD